MTACVREPFRHRWLCMKAHLVFCLPLTAAFTSTRLQQFVNSQQNAAKSSRNYLLLISKRKTITSVDYSKHNTRRSDTRKHQPPHNPVKLSTDHGLISEITGPLIGIWKWRGMWWGLVASVRMSDHPRWKVSNIVFYILNKHALHKSLVNFSL